MLVDLEGKSADDLMELPDGCDEDTPWEKIKIIMDRLEELDPQPFIHADIALKAFKENYPTVFSAPHKGRRHRRAGQLLVVAAALVAAFTMMACAVFPSLFELFVDKDTFIISGRLELGAEKGTQEQCGRWETVFAAFMEMLRKTSCIRY